MDLPPFGNLPLEYQAAACLGFVLLPLIFGLFMTAFTSGESGDHIE